MMECFAIWFPLLLLVVILSWCLWMVYCDLQYYSERTNDLLHRLRPLSDMEYMEHKEQEAQHRGGIDVSFDD